VKPSLDTEAEAAGQAAFGGHVDIVKYIVEERNIPDNLKLALVAYTAGYGQLDCLKYLLEEAKIRLHDWRYTAEARYFEHSECVNYLREKGCPELTDEEYAEYEKILKQKLPSSRLMGS